MFGGYYFGETYLANYAGIIVYLLSLADSVTSSDTKVFTITLAKSDSATATDAIAKTVSIIQADSITSSDAIVKTPTVKPSDSVTASDAIVKTITLNKSDTTTTIDVFSKVSTWYRSFADTISVIDSITITARSPDMVNILLDVINDKPFTNSHSIIPETDVTVSISYIDSRSDKPSIESVSSKPIIKI